MRAEPIRARRAARFRSRTSRSTSTQAGRSAEASSSASVGRRSIAWVSAIGSERGRVIEAMAVEVAEAGGFAQKDQLDRAGLAVSVLRDDQLGQALLVRIVLVVDLVAIYERH